MRQLSLILAVFIILFTGFFSPAHALPVNDGFSSLIGLVNISATIPDSPSTIVAYQVIVDPNDMAYYSVDDLVKYRPNITSEIEAPAVTNQILESYGGLPQGAKLTLVKTEYVEGFNLTTQQITSREAVSTNIQYARYINDIPVVGEGAYINIELGDSGELLYLNKVWRTVTPAGNFSIIPLSTAIEKLRLGEVLNPKSESYNVNITKIRLGYYEKGRNETQEYLDPAWLFRGITEDGDPITFYVYARHFVNFTAGSTEIDQRDTVQFTDTSETAPTQWLWDFGDGTNSTAQNPEHTYPQAGNFTVSLKAWNDMGSDNETKTDYITVHYKSPLNANFTATPTIASLNDEITFTDLSNNTPTKWYWEFGDGMSSTLQNPTHTYTTGGNFTVNLTVWNTIGNDTVSRPDYIYIYPTAAPVAGFTSNYSWEEPMSPVVIAFNDTSIGNITHWYWDFGDGNISTEQNPVHQFVPRQDEMDSYYELNLTVVDDYGRTSTNFDGCMVKKGFHPDFTGSPRRGFSPLNVTFTDLTPDMDWARSIIWDFGDDSNFTPDEYPLPQTVFHEYTTPGKYNVTLTYNEWIPRFAAARFGEPAYNETQGYSESDGRYVYYKTKEYYIIVISPELPRADFSANLTSGKEPLAVGFEDISSGLPDSWTWSFGDGTSSTDQDPVHTYSAGNYTVSLAVTNANCINTTTKTDYITVLSRYAPSANFTANRTEGYMPLAVAFSDNSANTPVSWSWNFGDNTTSAEQTPNHLYQDPGKYTVSLSVTNDDGTDDMSRTGYITVYPELPPLTLTTPSPVPPVADFNANRTSGKVALIVGFNDTSLNSPTEWDWDFGDGTQGASQNPVHTYIAAGTYTVTLTATNIFGSNSTTKTDYITVLPLNPPVSNFTAAPVSGTSPLTVTFTDTSTSTPTRWNWSFGDGAVSDEQNPVHEYTDSGTFTVSLETANADGRDTKIRPDYISVTSVFGPAANFTARPTCGKAPLQVTFRDTSTGTPSKWYWKFGDGTNASVQNPVHTYTANGKYTVSLTVTNAGGSSMKTRADYISVSGSLINPPVAKFTGKPTSGTAPLTVIFTDRSTGTPAGWYWNFGEGMNSTQQNPVHIYTSPGTYTVSLKVTNDVGSNTRTEKDYVTVKFVHPPSADFSGKPKSGNAPLAVQFNDTSGGFPTRWDWNFGDGTNSTQQHPLHTYSLAGKYTVSLTASNTGGSSTKSRPQYITVYAPAPTPTTTTIKPTTTCTAKPTATCTTKPTTTCTTKPVTTTTTKPPCTAPHVTGTAGNSSVRLDWDRITDPEFQGYKVVISKNNPGPSHPDDGYLYWITDRNQTSAVIDARTGYHGGDFRGSLIPGQDYYFSITAVYADDTVPGNVVRMTFPGSER